MQSARWIFWHLQLAVLILCAGLFSSWSSAQTAVRFEDMAIYAGNTHSHSANTWSHGEQYEKAPAAAKGEKKKGMKVLRKDWQKVQGPPAEHFARARTNGYHFYFVTDHSQEQGFQPVSATNATWVAAREQAARAEGKGFVALAGFEHSENNGPGGTGHINVFNTAEYQNAMEPGVDLPFFYGWLKTAGPAGPGPVVASFNHPGGRGFGDWAHADPEIADKITLLEVINSNDNIHYEAFLRALARGWKVAPVCGNDNHGFYGITHHASRTMVMAPGNSRADILQALKDRRVYASLEGNLQCRYTVNGTPMGSTLQSTGEFKFNIVLKDPDAGKPEDRITRIDVVKDGGASAQTWEGEPAHSVVWSPVVTDNASRFFFVRVWNAGGGDGKNPKPAEPVAWLAPVWTGR